MKTLRRRGESGAIFVEFALIVPILMLLSMGIVEYGLAWKWATDANAAVRDAGRSGATNQAFLTTDKTILLSIGAALSPEQIDAIERIVVFRAGALSGSVPHTCLVLTPSTAPVGSPVGRRGTCNVYSKEQLGFTLANPTDNRPWVNESGTGCDPSDLDRFWCPALRDNSATNADYLGVYIKLTKPSVTHFGFGDQTIQRTAIFRIEPVIEDSWSGSFA